MVHHVAKRLTAVAAVSALVAACGGGPQGAASAADPWGSDYQGVRVVATVPPIVDLVQRVAGDNKVIGIVPSGVDSHTYEPRPEDARTLSQADAFFTPAEDAAPAVTKFAYENLPEDAATILLAAAIPPQEFIYNESAEEIAEHGHGHDINVHAWTAPRYAAAFARYAAEKLQDLDTDAESQEYQDNAQELDNELRQLDTAIRAAVKTIPEPNRRLVVYHDSWDYFARDYGLEVVGTIQAADLAEPSAAEVGAMAQQIEQAGVPAFFGSEVFPSDVLESLEAETGAEYVGDLSDDRLPGEPGDPEHSYVGMMVQNVRLMVDALGGDASPLDSVDPAA